MVDIGRHHFAGLASFLQWKCRENKPKVGINSPLDVITSSVVLINALEVILSYNTTQGQNPTFHERENLENDRFILIV
jgi:hypothetical protein